VEREYIGIGDPRNCREAESESSGTREQWNREINGIGIQRNRESRNRNAAK